MMVIKGRGGEGKSQIGVVLSKLFGTNMKDGSIGKISENRFAPGRPGTHPALRG